MHQLPDKQIKVLRLRSAGVEFKDMKRFRISQSTAYDAFHRAQRNLDSSIEIIELAVREKWLNPEQIQRLKEIIRKL